MIRNLKFKALNEKYHRSIRYFSHILKGEDRHKFILELSDYNIYLSAQCLMSSEKDEDFENKLIKKAEIFAKEFENLEKATKGFLALAEFESFEIISNLLTQIKKPVKLHFKVLSEILRSGNSETFIKFIKVLTEIKSVPFIETAINSFNSPLDITYENQKTINNLINYLNTHGEFDLLHTFLTKNDLFDELPRIIKLKKGALIKHFLARDVTAFKIIYEIAKRNYALSSKEITSLIKLILQLESIDGVLLSLKIANDNNLQNISDLDESINKIIDQSSEKSEKQISQLLQYGLHKYLTENSNLENKLRKLFSNYDIAGVLFRNDLLREYLESSENRRKAKILKNLQNENLDVANLRSIMSKDDSPEKILNFYFTTRNLVALEILIFMIIEKFSITYKDISFMLRQYPLKGYVRNIGRFGCNVSCDFPITLNNTFFLHTQQIVEKKVSHANEVLQKGQEIEFRIIGINQQTLRLNISCLDIYKN